MNKCNCGSDLIPHWIYDGHGIPLCRVCPKCYESKMERYRPDILEAYECDEPIEPEE